MSIGRGCLRRLSSGPTIVALAVSSSNASRDRFPPLSSVVPGGPSSVKCW